MATGHEDARAMQSTPGEFDSFGIFRDSQGSPILARIQCGTKFIYRFLQCMPPMYLWMDTALWYQNVPNSWSGDYFVDSNVCPIMFRYRPATGSDEIRYQRIVSHDKLLAIMESDEATIHKLDAAEEKEFIAEAVSASVGGAELDTRTIVIRLVDREGTKRARTAEDTHNINE